MAETVSVTYLRKALVRKQAELKWAGEKFGRDRHAYNDMVTEYKQVCRFRTRECALLQGEVAVLEQLIEEAEHDVTEYDVAH